MVSGEQEKPILASWRCMVRRDGVKPISVITRRMTWSPSDSGSGLVGLLEASCQWGICWRSSVVTLSTFIIVSSLKSCAWHGFRFVYYPVPRIRLAVDGTALLG